MPYARSRRRTVTLSALAGLTALVAITAAVGESARAGDPSTQGAKSAGGALASAKTTRGSAANAQRLQQAKDADRQAAQADSLARGGSQAEFAAPNTWFVGSAGTYLVGRSLGPGTYKSAAPRSGTCHWARLQASSHIVAAGKTAGWSVVTIRKTDKYFETSGCENWHLIS